MSNVQLQRCICMPGATNFELHGFSDASQAAIAGVVYLRTVDSVGRCQVSLVAAKTHIVPKNKKTMPKLELEGAVLMSKLLKTVEIALQLPINAIHAYTDSTIVLQWIQSSPDRWPTYIANRVSEIQDRFSPNCWHHVPGPQNPADCASRGISAEEFLTHPLWWTGPPFVRDGTITEFHASKEDGPTETIQFAGHASKTNDILEKYSSYSKLLRITTYCLRFAHNCSQKDKSKRLTGWLTTKELQNSEVQWAKVMQITYLEQLHKILTNNADPKISEKQEIPKPFLALSPFLDEHSKVIRVGGRLQNSHLPYDKKHPLLLPKACPLTSLLFQYEHKKNLHAGPQLMLAVLQQRFWIVGARSVARKISRQCVTCHRYKAESAEQLMAPLPLVRATPANPFLRVGIDFAGPIILKNIKGRSRTTYKGYIALFVCLSTKAIHLELVDALSTEACINAIIRFTSRRGKPQVILSDSGRSLVGAKRRLSELELLLSSKANNDMIAKRLAEDNIHWHLNPVYAPHFGGLWEAGIKSMKHHLHRVLGNAVLNYAEMNTMLTQVEACLNSRPLTPMSSDPNDLTFLTPGHFLIGRPLTALPQLDYDFDKISHLTRWHLLQRMLQHFWKRWSREFLTRLQQHPKWWKQHENLKIDDLVLIKEDNQPPQKWKLGRITAVHPGLDNLVRAVTVKTEDGLVNRAISKLSRLPYDD